MKATRIGITIFVSSFFSVLVQAQDLNFSQYRRFLMNGANGKGQKMALQTTCKNSKGQVYRIGEKGYDTCLSSNKKPESTIHIGK